MSADLERLQLEERIRQLKAGLQAWLSRKKILTRWPCFYCGRKGPSYPLRTVRIINEDGEEYMSGCDPCNDDDLIARTEKLLK